MLQQVTDHLLTPFGLRSLSPQDPAYREHFNGNQAERDAAYRQGLGLAVVDRPIYRYSPALIQRPPGLALPLATIDTALMEYVPGYHQRGYGTRTTFHPRRLLCPGLERCRITALLAYGGRMSNST